VASRWITLLLLLSFVVLPTSGCRLFSRGVPCSVDSNCESGDICRNGRCVVLPVVDKDFPFGDGGEPDAGAEDVQQPPPPPPPPPPEEDAGAPPAEDDAGVVEPRPEVDAGAPPEVCPVALDVVGDGGRLEVATDAPGWGLSCGGPASVQIFTLTFAATTDLFVATHGNPADTVIALMSGDCLGAELACNDDADGRVTSVLTAESLEAGTYTLVVGTSEPVSAPLVVHIYPTVPSAPADKCGRALPLPAAGAVGDSCTMTPDNTPTCEQNSSLQGPDAIYYFVVDDDGSGVPAAVELETCTGCSAYDTSLELRSNCAEPGVFDQLTCNDDAQPACQSECDDQAVQSRLAADLEPGLYFAYVDGWGNECGEYELRATGLGEAVETGL
jgi:hypothetical protein